MRWKLKPLPDAEKLANLKQSGINHDVLATLFIQRNINSFEAAKSFCNPTLDELHDPYLMKDMDVAVSRVLDAISNRERILIFGDYDVDGTTAVSMMYLYLKTKTDLLSHYIPDRYTEGYGVSKKGIDFAADNDFSLIIALDCGIKSVELVAYAKTLGIEFIICDHHQPGKTIPDAAAVLNPKRLDCNYPYKELCGCGVGFKLIQALEMHFENDSNAVFQLLDFVAIAIAADIVPLTGENRTLAFFGLKLINSSCRTGLKALKKRSKNRVLELEDLVFVFAPRINAAGRINLGRDAVELMIETDETAASSFADTIEEFNRTRREYDQNITIDALSQIQANQETDAAATVVFDESWNKGVIGIVASRLIETYYRPTLVFTKSNGVLAASGRSVFGFDLYEALENCSEHLEQFGGHTFAAGMTIKPENFLMFKNAFNEFVLKTRKPEHFEPEIEIDLVINANQISESLIDNFSRLAPFGPQHMKPVFQTNRFTVGAQTKEIGKTREHLRLELISDDGRKFFGVGFKLGCRIPSVNSKIDVVYTLSYNEFRDQRTLQLVVIDFKTSAS